MVFYRLFFKGKKTILQVKEARRVSLLYCFRFVSHKDTGLKFSKRLPRELYQLHVAHYKKPSEIL
jgi:hypothetical protein